MTPRGRYRIASRFVVDGQPVDREQTVAGERLDDMLRAELLTPGELVSLRVTAIPSSAADRLAEFG